MVALAADYIACIVNHYWFFINLQIGAITKYQKSVNQPSYLCWAGTGPKSNRDWNSTTLSQKNTTSHESISKRDRIVKWSTFSGNISVADTYPF